MRFLGRRVYLALAVVLVRPGRAGTSGPRGERCTSAGSSLGEQFPLTPLWRAGGARAGAHRGFGRIARTAGPAHEALTRLLVWLSPVTVGAIELREDRHADARSQAR